MTLPGPNTLSYDFEIDNATQSSTSDTTEAMSGGLVVQTSELPVANLAAGTHQLALLATDDISGNTSVALPVYTNFLDSDGDGIANVVDSDDDNDGVADVTDLFPLDALVSVDTDQDGIGDAIDPDDDNDGVPDADDADPTNVDHLSLGAPTQASGLFVLQDARIEFIDSNIAASEATLMLDSQGQGLAMVDRVGDDVSVDTNRDYDAIRLTIADTRVASTEINLPFSAAAFAPPVPLPGMLSVTAAVPLEAFASAQLDSTANGLLAVFDANFDAVGPEPYLQVEVSLSGAPGTFVATFADRTVDDDTLPAFMDPDLDDDGVLNDADAFPEDAARSADADGDGIDDIEDTDDDNDGVPDVDDAFPFDPTRSVDPDTDGDGTPNSVDTDDDGDGVPDAEDAAPLESDVGAFLQIAAPEAQLLAVAPGYLADPGFATGIFNGTLHEFTGDGTGQVITPNGNLPLAWTLSGGVLEVVYSPEPDDAEASFLLASDLVELGVANPAEVDTFISTNGDRQVEFTITLGSASFYLLSDDGNSQQYWVSSSEHFQVANDEDRILLFGAIDASARPAIDASESRQLVVDTLTIVSADVGEDVPLDSDRLALPARVVPDESPGRRVQYDIVNFADTGAGSFESDSEAITWSYDADNRLVINRPDTGGQVVITVLDTLDPGYTVWTLATEGTETYSFFGLAVPDELLADTGDWINPFVGHFVISSYSTTDPAAYDNTGLLQDAFVFGHVLEADGTAPRIVDATAFDGDELFTQRWYWRLEGRKLILTGRFQADDEEFYSACDPATDPACMEWRVRHWLPLTVSGDRAYILEWEEISESGDPADPQYSALITPRTHFYAIHRQDRDSDTFYDIDELLAGLNPDNADSDNDGTDDAFDVFPLNEAESSDVDGDGIGDNADLDDDNDGMPDSFEIEHGLDPLVDDAAADKDGDGLSNLAEFEQGSNPDDANDPNTNTGTATLVNISTRGQVRLGDEVMIGGLVIAGDAPMTVLVRARGPGLADFGVPGVLPDPRVSLFLGPDQIGSNDDWQSAGNSGDIPASLRPTNDKASAILVTLEPGAYTAIVEGVGGTTGVGIVEVFEVTATGTAHLVNISTRGFVGDGDDVLIGGLIISGDRPKTIAVTGRGPSLAAFGVPNTLDDPQLSLYDQAGNLLESNDSWQATSRVNDIPAFVSLTDGREAVIVRTVEPGAYTAILSGVGGTSGTGIVEVFEVD